MPPAVLQLGRWLAAPALGAVATLGHAPYGLWPLTILSLALLCMLAARQSVRGAAWSGFAFGFAHYATGIYWVYISTHVYGHAPAVVSLLMAALLFAYLALFPAAWLALAARLGWFRSAAGWVGLPATWLLLELLRGVLLSGFPWLSPGELALDTPLERLGPVTGVHGLAAVVVWMAVALQRLADFDGLRARMVATAALLAPALTLALPPPSAWTESAGAPVSIALVQSNIKQDEKWLPHMRQEALVRHWRMTQAAWPADIVIWPEVALTEPLHRIRDNYLADLDRQAAGRNATILLGLLVIEDEQTRHNSVIAVGADQGRYDKRHLVPFGEFFPIPDFLRPLMDVIGTPYKDMTAGAESQPLLIVGGHPIALSICFEDVFADEVRHQARASDFLINMTNDAWFALSSAPHQHLQFSRLRALENGRWLARTANTGISALINPDGQVVARTPQFSEAVLRGTLEPRRGHTPYQRWGDAPLWGLSILLIAAAVWRTRRAARP